jgi:hypothetical protein
MFDASAFCTQSCFSDACATNVCYSLFRLIVLGVCHCLRDSWKGIGCEIEFNNSRPFGGRYYEDEVSK